MSNTNESSMDELTLKEILTEQFEENKAVKKFMEELKQHINKRDEFIEDMFATFEHEYSNLKVFAPEPDFSEISHFLEKGFEKVTAAVDKRPKPIERSWKINLFPEHNPREHYKLVYGRLIPALLGFIVLITACLIISESVDAYQAHQYNVEGNNCIKAWNYVYEHSGPTMRKRMTKALKEASR